MAEADRPHRLSAGAGERALDPGADERAVGPGADERAVDRADYDPNHDPAAPVWCEVCGGEMHYTASCKLKCPRCGYMRDCSDP